MKRTITGLQVNGCDIDRFVSNYLNGTPVEIAGTDYHIDTFYMRDGHGIADVTSRTHYEIEPSYDSLRDSRLITVNDTYDDDGINALLKVDRSLLNRKGKRAAKKAREDHIDHEIEHQYDYPTQSDLTFDEAWVAAIRGGMAIRRKSWLNRYWAREDITKFYNLIPHFCSSKLIETFVRCGVESTQDIAITLADRKAADWESIDIHHNY